MSRPEHLVEYYEKKRKNTFDLVEQAIALLKRRKARVTYSAIRGAVQELTGGVRVISETTISRNPAVQELYAEAASPFNKRVRSDPSKPYLADFEGDARKRESEALTRLRRKTKVELAVTVRKYEHEVQKLKGELATLRAAQLDNLIPESITFTQRRQK